MMKAARLHAAGDLRVEDVPSPGEPAPGWVRLKVTAAGICGSDLHNFRTGQWISRAPSVAGHEFAGEVTAVGAGVSQFALGDRVVADSRFWCGECPACRAGLHNVCARLGFVGEVCDGGFAEETQLPARLLVRHDATLDPAIAAMAEPLAVALHAVRRLAVPAGAPVLIAGCGPIGGLAALLLSRPGERQVLVADRNATRSQLVAKVSGTTVVDLDALPRDPSVRHAIDATGSVAVMARLLDVLAGGGTLALVGISHGRLDLDPNLLVEREIALVGCHAFTDELAPAVAMLGDLAPALSRFVAEEIAIGEIPAAYQRLIAGASGGLKTIVRMERG